MSSSPFHPRGSRLANEGEREAVPVRVLGINCTSNEAYVALLEDGVVLDGYPERLRLPGGVEGGEGLLEFIDEVRRTLAQARPDHVVLLLPEGRQRGATYQRIAPRVVLETLVRLAAAQENVPTDLLARATVRARLGLPRSGSLDDQLSHAGTPTGHYWNNGRGLAALAGFAALEG